MACGRFHLVARKYLRRHSRVSHMRSSSESGVLSASFFDVVGRDSQDRTSARSWSYLVCWSAVRTGGGAGLHPGAGSVNGPIADIVHDLVSVLMEITKFGLFLNRQENCISEKELLKCVLG